MADESDDFEYGKEYPFVLEPTVEDRTALIWPDWRNGVPTILRKDIQTEPFAIGSVKYKSGTLTETIKYDWQTSRSLTGAGRLPSRFTEERSGVYRIFAPDRKIGRVCGDDPTGTLYIGRSGSQTKSFLRSRVKQVLSKSHHAIGGVGFLCNRESISVGVITRGVEFHIAQNKLPWRRSMRLSLGRGLAISFIP